MISQVIKRLKILQSLNHDAHTQLIYSFLSNQGKNFTEQTPTQLQKAIKLVEENEKLHDQSNKSLIFFDKSQKPVILMINLTILLNQMRHVRAFDANNSFCPGFGVLNKWKSQCDLHVTTHVFLLDVVNRYFDSENPRIRSEVFRNWRLIKKIYKSNLRELLCIILNTKSGTKVVGNSWTGINLSNNTFSLTMWMELIFRR